MGTVEGGRRVPVRMGTVEGGRRVPPQVCAAAGAVGTSRPSDRRTLEHDVLRLTSEPALRGRL